MERCKLWTVRFDENAFIANEHVNGHPHLDFFHPVPKAASGVLSVFVRLDNQVSVSVIYIANM